MGYESSFHLIGVKIKPASLPAVKQALETGKVRGWKSLEYFLEVVVFDADGYLTFKASEDGLDPYCAFDDGTVPALSGKWYEAERIAAWLKKHSAKGGRMVFHSQEADGEAWGWEFDGRGRMRLLKLRPVGKWR